MLWNRAGILKSLMGARNRGGIGLSMDEGLSYRPAMATFKSAGSGFIESESESSISSESESGVLMTKNEEKNVNFPTLF